MTYFLIEVKQTQMEEDIHCYDINYWLFDEVSNKLRIKEDNPTFFNIIDSIHNVWDDINNNLQDKTKMCQPDSTLMDIPVLKEFKYLFDYAEDRYVLREEALKDTPNSCKQYFKYIKRFIPIYYTNKSFCSNTNINICNRYLGIYEYYDPKHLSRYIKLSNLLAGLIWYPCYRNVLHIFLSALKQPQRLEVKTRTRRTVEKNVETPAEINMISLAGKTIFNIIYSFPYYYIMSPFIFILLPIFILFLLYKFIPQGKAMLCTLARIRKKIRNNISYEDVSLLNDNSKSLFRVNSEDSSYNLQYQCSCSDRKKLH
ncbi:variable surface protein [Plasmodium gonderi]|uniref:Variable surface protein n=1 Tax=Plasmodium gonderi TaxID=77519 RepID=A0A1Y1JTM0_PLAGO|nr:variable surface protein [Plasmodium gonderi]GAW84102.1 variable surface protein [Plasmodium gonderi]